MQKPYEQSALFFNLVQIGANGTALPKAIHISMFGPVIAISRADYFAAGGHEGVRSAVVEDMALARNLRRAGIPYSVFVGDAGVSFRMYPAGFRSLWQGFTKNLATGAVITPLPLFLPVSLFLASVISAPLHLILSLARGKPLALLYGALYFLWVVVLFLLGRRSGRFSLLTSILYPLPLTGFLLVFFYSFFLRLFHGDVRWKGRVIKPER